MLSKSINYCYPLDSFSIIITKTDNNGSIGSGSVSNKFSLLLSTYICVYKDSLGPELYLLISLTLCTGLKSTEQQSLSALLFSPELYIFHDVIVLLEYIVIYLYNFQI